MGRETGESSIRRRSPNFPSVALDEAEEALKKLCEEHRRAPAPRELAAKVLGYGTLNGPAARVLGSLTQYGLIEDAGQGRIRVTDLGEGIAYPRDGDERVELLQTAFNSPRIYAILLGKHGVAGMPSDATLRAELIREHKFTAQAAETCVASFRRGLDLLRAATPSRPSQTPDGPAALPDTSAGMQLPEAARVRANMALGASAGDAAGIAEVIAGKLSANTRVELRIAGPLGPRELTKLDAWLRGVVVPWAHFVAEELEAGSDE